MDELNYALVVREVTYKPNMGIQVYTQDDQRWIRITAWVENSRGEVEPWEVKKETFYEYSYEELTYDSMSFPEPTYVGPRRRVIQLQGNYPIPYFYAGDEQSFLNWLRGTIRIFEEHEMDEWFKYKGEMLNDPHDPGVLTAYPDFRNL